MEINSLLDMGPYSLGELEKKRLFDSYLNNLTKYHYSNCEDYRKVLDSIGFNLKMKVSYSKIPFLPVRLFKLFDLYSIPKKNIFKTMTSSGTTGQSPSKIFLDKQTATNQSKVLVKIISKFLGSKRAPMIIIDSPEVLKDRNSFSARGAGILGFSIFGEKRIYALDKEMKLNIKDLLAFVKVNQGKSIFIFGFTFIIFQHFIKVLQKHNIKLNLSKSVLIHGGGWKKLQNEKVSSEQFRDLLKEYCSINNVFDYYGMVEQTGSIYMECEYGNLHASIFSDVIFRRAKDFSECGIGETGIIQTISIIPKSYPGHSLLTEDQGTLLGIDNCKCGRLGKYFKVFGRIENAEIRGCSDTYEG